MPNVCFVFGQKVSFGNTRSKSNIKTRRKFSPNMISKTFFSDTLNQNFDLKISTRGLRTIHKHGSLDNYLLTTRMLSLTPEAYKLKYKVRSRLKKQELQTAKN
jgi:large subunit ribosomal protein L28